MKYVIYNYIKKLFSINRRSAISKVCNSIYARLTLFWDPIPECRQIVVEKHIYNYLKRKYLHVKGEDNNTDISNEEDFVIWLCWFQGYDDAPLLVKRCIDNIVSLYGDNYTIKLITKKNFQQYANLPEYIVEKWMNHKISDAHFSDLIRLECLIKHGGCWIDSTVFCSSKELPDYITKSELFLFTTFSLNDIEVSKISNWLIAAKPNNILLRETQRMLYAYWRDFDYAINYYIFHLFFTIAASEFPDEWNKIPKLNNLNPHVLQWEFDKTYSESRLQMICKWADFHKLTYRLEKTCNKEGCFYDIMINRGEHFKKGVNINERADD